VGGNGNRLRWHAYVAASILAVGLILAIWGYQVYYARGGLTSHEALEAVLSALKLFKSTFDGPPAGLALEDVPWQIVAARLLVPIGSFYAVLLLAYQLFRRRRRAFFARWKRGHTVIAGPGAALLAPAVAAAGRASVAILGEPTEATRQALDDIRIPVIQGDAAISAVLGRAGLARAAALVVAGPDGATNAEVALAAHAFATARRRNRPLDIAAEIDDPDLVAALGLDALAGPARIRVVSRAQVAVRRLFMQFPPDLAAGCNRGGRVHMLLFGFGPINRQAALALARTAHYADRRPPRITILTERSREVDAFVSAHPGLASAAQISCVALDPRSGDLDGDEIRSCCHELPPSGAIVCLGVEPATLAFGVRLRRVLDKMGHGADVAVHLPTLHHGAQSLQSRSKGVDCGRLLPFGQLDAETVATDFLGERLDRLARAHHEHYLPTARGGPADRPWSELGESYREASRHAADHIAAKLRVIGADLVEQSAGESFRFAESELERLAEIEHRRWCAERLLAGWERGAARDDARRLHPSLVPWDELSETEREKDRQVVKAIPEIARAAGYHVRRIVG
jgi:voltage-gated potassium channel Kch